MENKGLIEILLIGALVFGMVSASGCVFAEQSKTTVFISLDKPSISFNFVELKDYCSDDITCLIKENEVIYRSHYNSKIAVSVRYLTHATVGIVIPKKIVPISELYDLSVRIKLPNNWNDEKIKQFVTENIEGFEKNIEFDIDIPTEFREAKMEDRLFVTFTAKMITSYQEETRIEKLASLCTKYGIPFPEENIKREYLPQLYNLKFIVDIPLNWTDSEVVEFMERSQTLTKFDVSLTTKEKGEYKFKVVTFLAENIDPKKEEIIVPELSSFLSEYKLEKNYHISREILKPRTEIEYAVDPSTVNMQEATYVELNWLVTRGFITGMNDKDILAISKIVGTSPAGDFGDVRVGWEGPVTGWETFYIKAGKSLELLEDKLPPQELDMSKKTEIPRSDNFILHLIIGVVILVIIFIIWKIKYKRG